MTQNFASEEIRKAVEEKQEADRQKKERITKYVMISATVLAGICAVICAKKLSDNNKLMKAALKRVNSMTSVDIPQALIEDAVTNATNAQVGEAVRQSVNSIKDIIGNETRKRVMKAVDKSYDKVEESVIKAIKKEVIKISAEDLAAEVREAAKESLVEKLEDKFDDVVEDITDAYTRNIENIGRVYEAIARKSED